MATVTISERSRMPRGKATLFNIMTLRQEKKDTIRPAEERPKPKRKVSLFVPIWIQVNGPMAVRV